MNIGVCHVPLATGGVMTVTARAHRQSGELQGIKAAAGAQAVRTRLHEVLARARLDEVEDQGWRVAVDIQPPPAPGDDAWELAAAVADRIARGGFRPSRKNLWAIGRFADPVEGGLDGGLQSLQRIVPPADAAARLLALVTQDLTEAQLLVAVGETNGADGGGEVPPTVAERCGDLIALSHLANLGGHPDPGGLLRTAQVWFPGVSGHGANDRLLAVQVAARPLGAGREGGIRIVGLSDENLARQALQAARSGEPRGGTGWQTLVRFARPTGAAACQIDGRSFELALVLADRIARGREVPPRGRLIASGMSAQWLLGTVETVAGGAEKCTLIASELATGDRVLLPAAWQNECGEALAGLQARAAAIGASSALIEKI